MTNELGYPLQTGSSTSVRVVHPAEFSAATLQTPGSLRMAAISAKQGVASSMWAGTFLVEPSAKTGIHHHGEQETIVYVLEGEALVGLVVHQDRVGGDLGRLLIAVRRLGLRRFLCWLG